jgi:hypothetical protein
MEVNRRFDLSDYADIPNPGLTAYLNSTKYGNQDEYRTTFYKDKTLDEVCDAWADTLKKISKQWPGMFEFENDLRKKVGPLSIQKPFSERIDDVVSYYDSILLESQPILPEAIDKTIAWLKGSRSLNVRGIPATLDKMKKSTSAGLPYFTKKRNVVSKTIPFTVTSDYQILRSNKWRNAAILGWRGQEGGPGKEDVKQRVVWMFPFATNIAELQLYQVLIEWVQNNAITPVWSGNDAVDASITKLFDTKAKDDLVICTDFSKFDQHFNSHMQGAARDILKGMFAPTATFTDWIDNVFPIKYEIALLCQPDYLVTGPHGMGSGSGGTNADETIAHKALQFEAAIRAGKELNPYSLDLGDDGILSYPGITVEDVVQAYSSHGQEMNIDKQYASKHDCVFLRRYHHEDYRVNGICVGVYSTYRALNRLCEQERYYDPDIWGPKMVAMRQLSIIENVSHHPLREEFADYCMKGDKYRLGLDIPGFLDNLDKEYKEAIANIPDFFSYSQGFEEPPPISTWWIVQYLKSKR